MAFDETTNAYIESSRSFVQLSSAGLVVPVTLKLFENQPLPADLRWGVAFSWLAFLFAIGCGVLYQYAAIKTYEYKKQPDDTFVPFFLKRMVTREQPGNLYGAMLIAFLLGAGLLVVYVAIALL